MTPPRRTTEAHPVGVIAGVQVLSDKLFPGLPTSGFHDLSLTVYFVPHRDLANHKALEEDSHSFPVTVGVTGQLALDGTWVAIEADPEGLLDFPKLIRRVLPFAAALQGAIILHASAVSTANGVHAFIGASGVGKSTLAVSLTKLGLDPIADDLLPCREQDGVIVVPHPRTEEMQPIRTLFFLDRDVAAEEVSIDPLSPMECMKLLLKNGFGEVSLKDIWATQFTMYGLLAQTVTANKLILPDDIARLDGNSIEVKALLRQRDCYSRNSPAGS